MKKEETKEENNNDDCACCACACIGSTIDRINEFWDKYKYKISSPLAVILSILGALSGFLVSKDIIIGGIAIAFTNCSVFFASILLSKFSTENRYLNNDNTCLKNENRRLTVFNDVLSNKALSTAPDYNITPTSQTSNESIQPVDFDNLHRNNRICTFVFPNE